MHRNQQTATPAGQVLGTEEDNLNQNIFTTTNITVRSCHIH